MSTIENSRHLVISDSGPEAWIGQVCGVPSSMPILEVLPLGMSQSRYRTRYGSELEGVRTWGFADVTRLVPQARAVIRDRVPQLMVQLRSSRIGGKTSLLDRFQRRGFNGWWFLEVSEKSAYRGLLINRMYYLALIQSLLASTTYQKVWFCLEDEVLSRSLNEGLKLLSIDCTAVKSTRLWSKRGVGAWLILHLWNALGIGMLHVLQLLLISGLGIVNRRSPPPQSVLLFSFYPRMWSAPYGASATEWFFGDLPKFFSGAVSHCYALWLTVWPREIWAKRKELRSFFSTQKALCLSQYAGVGALASLFDPRWWMMHVRLARRWPPANEFRLGPFDVGEMVSDELHRSLSSTEFFRDVLLVDAWERLTRSSPVAAVLYRLEFQPFENAILYGARGNTRTIAFQHSLFGNNYLPYHFVPGELSHVWDRGAMPLPGLIITSGEFGHMVMLKNGCAQTSVEVCGPVRYREFFKRYGQHRDRRDEARKRLGLDREAKTLVVATAVSRPDAEALLEALGEGVEHFGNLIVMFKSHPALSLDKEFERIVGVRLGGARYRLLASGEELYDALSLADVAVVNPSTVALEALVLGALPVIFDSGVVFDPKVLESDEWGGVIASNAEQLSQALGIVFGAYENLEAVKQGLHIQAERWLDQPQKDPYPRFVEVLRKHGIVPKLGSAENES